MEEELPAGRSWNRRVYAHLLGSLFGMRFLILTYILLVMIECPNRWTHPHFFMCFLENYRRAVYSGNYRRAVFSDRYKPACTPFELHRAPFPNLRERYPGDRLESEVHLLVFSPALGVWVLISRFRCPNMDLLLVYDMLSLFDLEQGSSL